MLNIQQNNIDCLEQGIELIQRIDSHTYPSTCNSVGHGSIGAHIRHNIDHYICFLHGVSEGRVDYDARKRDANIELDKNCAITAMKEIIAGIQHLNENNMHETLLVKMDSGREDPAVWSQSSPHRELQFLISHTIHHYALVAMICRIQGIKIDPTFGIAPSTLKYKENLKITC